jgi:hypothetical protein
MASQPCRKLERLPLMGPSQSSDVRRHCSRQMSSGSKRIIHSTAAGVALLITATATAASAPGGMKHSLSAVTRAFAASGLPLERVSPTTSRKQIDFEPQELRLRNDFSVTVFPERESVSGLALVVGVVNGQRQRLLTSGNVVVRLSVGARSAARVRSALARLPD